MKYGSHITILVTTPPVIALEHNITDTDRQKDMPYNENTIIKYFRF